MSSYLRIKNWIRSHVYYVHAYVVSYDLGASSNPAEDVSKLDPKVARVLERARKFHENLELKQIHISDIEDIDELTEKDPFGVPKSVTLKELQDGCMCYVVKYKGQIVGGVWKKLQPAYYDSYLNRTFTLNDTEAYERRAFCVPAFKGKGIMPWLMSSVNNQLEITAGIKRHTGWIVRANKPMLNTMMQLGFSVVGRLGFFDIFGVRFHYLWGKNAYVATKKRCYIQWVA